MPKQSDQLKFGFVDHMNFINKMTAGFPGQLIVMKRDRIIMVVHFTGLENPTVSDFYELMKYLEKFYAQGVTFEYVVY